MSEHTPEPWTIYEPHQIWAQAISEYVAVTSWGDDNGVGYAQESANARRIVACVNACVGVPTRALESAAECAEHGIMPTLAAQYKAERDELRYALQELVDAKKREVFTVEVEADSEEELMAAWTEMHSYWCAAETALIKAVTP